MKETENTSVPFIVYESAMDRAERRDRRNVVVTVILIVLLVLSNIAWIIAWNQYDYIDDYVAVDAGNGIANYIGNDGDINNGKDSAQETDKDSP